jgi:flagellar biogenesis protein FliO
MLVGLLAIAAPVEPLASPGMGAALLQLLLALGLVCGLAVVVLRYGLKRLYRNPSGPDQPLRLVSRLALEPRRAVYLIEARGQEFLVGGGENALSLLAELGQSPPAQSPAPEVPAGTFRDVLLRALGSAPKTAAAAEPVPAQTTPVPAASEDTPIRPGSS